MEINIPDQPINPSETPIKPISNPVNKQRSFFPIILGILLLLVVTSVGAYYLGKQNSRTTKTSNITTKPTQAIPAYQPTPTANSTANWKTYENSDYSIKYPPDLKLERQDMPDIGNLVGFDSKDQQISITITTWEDNEGKTLQQFITDYSNNLATKENTNSYRVGEIQGLGYINGENKLIFINNKNKVFIFILNNAYDIKTHNLLNKNAEATFSQILSTFKFLDQTVDTGNWKTYQNTKYGYEFKYPSELRLQENIDNIRILQNMSYVFEVKKIDINDDIEAWWSKASKDYTPFILSKTQFNQKSAYYFKQNTKDVQVPMDMYAIKMNGYILTISYEVPFNLDLYPNDTSIETYKTANEEFAKTTQITISQILSAFKFTK